MRVSSLLLMATLTVLAIGCRGEKESDKLAKASVRILNEKAEQFEFLATKPSNIDEIVKTKERLTKLDQETKEVMEAVAKLPKGEWDASKEKFKPDMDKAWERLKQASNSAGPMKLEIKKN